MKKIFFLILIIIIFGGIFVWAGIYLPEELGSIEQKTFLVKKGEGAKEISINLERQGLIKWGLFFRIYVLAQGKAGELKAGEYGLSPAMTIPEITKKLVSGEVIKRAITIIEGWNLREIGGYFEEKGIATLEQLFELDRKEKKDSYFSKYFSFLADKPVNLGLDGYLFPDTYELFPEDGVEEIIRKMLTNFDKKLDLNLRGEIVLQKKSIFEIVIMASLIEKEVRIFEDKKIVSGILWKRLKSGIPLQVDATIVYIIGKKTTEISIEETKIDSPYNTYKYRGLPLGPISNPGLESIKAAIFPEDSEFWYYLSAPAANGEPRPNGREGKTIFSRTLEEHNIAKAKYLK